MKASNFWDSLHTYGTLTTMCGYQPVVWIFAFATIAWSSGAATPSSQTRPVTHAPRCVVLDPGHGGSNTGAAIPEELRSAGGPQYEKQLTLQLTKRVAAALRAKQSDLCVQSTREDDTYLTLRQRVEFANQLNASLFVSLHFNASPNGLQRGFEIYTLGVARARYDGQQTLVAMHATASPDKPLTDASVIASDLAQTGRQLQARKLAEAVRRHLVKCYTKLHRRTLDRGIKHYPYDVLLGLTMPAVLIEVGFLDHPDEGLTLQQEETLDALADGLARGILAAVAR